MDIVTKPLSKAGKSAGGNSNSQSNTYNGGRRPKSRPNADIQDSGDQVSMDTYLNNFNDFGKTVRRMQMRELLRKKEAKSGGTNS